MELRNVIQKRRAVREYKNLPIEKSTIQALIDAAIEAPSAMNLQPWAFCACLNQEHVESLANRGKNWLLEHSADLAAHSMLSSAEFALFHHAPALVLVLAKNSARQAIEDCCLAAENLMLAARNAELGTCWIGSSRPWLNLPSTKLELGIPESYCVVAPIVLGIPKAWPEPHGQNPAEVHWAD